MSISKKQKPEIFFDLSPYLRAPLSGVGLSSWRSFHALNSSENKDFTLHGIHRDPKFRSQSDFEFYSLPQRFMGKSNTLFHSFESARMPLTLNSKKVLTVHDVWTLEKNPYQDPDFQKSQAKKFRTALERADFFLTPTRSVKEKLERIYPECYGRVQYVHWGPVASDDTRTSETPFNSELSEYLKLNRPYFLMVGCLETRKNHNLLFSAFKKGLKADLVVVGTQGFNGRKIMADLEDLKNSVSGQRVIYSEAVEPALLLKLYDQATAVILPSFDEGFGIPAIEAMARGKVPVLSRIPSLIELAQNAAIFVDPNGNSDDLHEALSRLLTDEDYRRDYEKKARAQAQLYDWNKTAQTMRSVYRKVLNLI